MNSTQASKADLPAAERLRITEIFYSLQGETNTAGLPTVFVRLTGCPLRCAYCDTAYAFTGGSWMTLAQILQKVADYSPRYVCVTGGEPLAQPNCKPLLVQLCDSGCQVSIETSGAMDISDMDARVIRIMDLKTPASGEADRNRYDNIDQLRKADSVKFVICDRGDYDWSCDMLSKYDLAMRCEVLFSPSHEQLEASTLADWILEDRLPVRLQIQLHKYLWGDVPGR